MIEIYIADIRCLMQEDIFAEKLKMLPPERREKISRYKYLEDRARSLGAGLLLEYGLRLRGLTLLDDVNGVDDVEAVDDVKHVNEEGVLQKETHVRKPAKVELIYGAHGKPHLSGERKLYFNLSHSGDYAVAVFSDAEVGIDIERVREMKSGVVMRHFHPEERVYLEQTAGVCTEREKDAAFTELWTRKESYIKATGSGMSLAFESFSVLEDLVEQDERYRLYSFREPAGYCVSVCGKIEQKPEMVRVEL